MKPAADHAIGPDKTASRLLSRDQDATAKQAISAVSRDHQDLHIRDVGASGADNQPISRKPEGGVTIAVSYTHLTLPTSDLV